MERQLPDGRSARSHGLTLLPRQASPLVDDPPLPVHSRGPPNSGFQSPDLPRLEAIGILRGVGRKKSPRGWSACCVLSLSCALQMLGDRWAVAFPLSLFSR